MEKITGKKTTPEIVIQRMDSSDNDLLKRSLSGILKIENINISEQEKKLNESRTAFLEKAALPKLIDTSTPPLNSPLNSPRIITRKAHKTKGKKYTESMKKLGSFFKKKPKSSKNRGMMSLRLKDSPKRYSSPNQTELESKSSSPLTIKAKKHSFTPPPVRTRKRSLSDEKLLMLQIRQCIKGYETEKVDEISKKTKEYHSHIKKYEKEIKKRKDLIIVMDSKLTSLESTYKQYNDIIADYIRLKSSSEDLYKLYAKNITTSESQKKDLIKKLKRTKATKKHQTLEKELKNLVNSENAELDKFNAIDKKINLYTDHIKNDKMRRTNLHEKILKIRDKKTKYMSDIILFEQAIADNKDKIDEIKKEKTLEYELKTNRAVKDIVNASPEKKIEFINERKSSNEFLDDDINAESVLQNNTYILQNAPDNSFDDDDSSSRSSLNSSANSNFN